MNKSEVLKKLNLEDPYDYVKTLDLDEFDGPSWGGKCDIYGKIIDENRPSLIIELGAFLGNSTISMAQHLKQNNIQCTIITIDTWLGSAEHWRTDKCNMLHLFGNFKNGTSKLYDQFLKNVVSAGVEDYIVPMPTTTDVAFDVLSHNNFLADIIYMDADHRETVIYADLINYSKLLTRDGIVFGHDIDWEGVKNAVSRYCNEKNKTYVELKDNIEDKIKFWKIR